MAIDALLAHFDTENELLFNNPTGLDLKDRQLSSYSGFPRLIWTALEIAIAMELLANYSFLILRDTRNILSVFII